MKSEITIYSEIINKVPVRIDKADDELIIFFNDGSNTRFYHQQECCESFEINDVVGDLDDLIGNPLLKAESRSQESDGDGYDSAMDITQKRWIIGSIRQQTVKNWLLKQ